MESLERALLANRTEVEREMANAEVELVALRQRINALEALISRARNVLGLEGDSDPLPDGREVKADQSLHGVLIRILRERGNAPMTARALADAVNRSGLYRKRDGSDVDPSQIHARVHRYAYLFVRDEGGIRLQEAEPRSTDRSLLRRFDKAMQGVYDGALSQVGYSARRFLNMVHRRGGLQAAQHLLAQPGESEGFRRLARARKLELTMEYQVLRPEFKELFTEEERDIAKRRLTEAGLDPGRLAVIA